jgi:hypothetical protein
VLLLHSVPVLFASSVLFLWHWCFLVAELCSSVAVALLLSCHRLLLCHRSLDSAAISLLHPF